MTGNPKRLHTDQEILAAGAAAVRGFAPLTDTEIFRIAALLAPVAHDDHYWRRLDQTSRGPEITQPDP